MNKTPREFRNALYQYFVDNDVEDEIASQLAGEAEMYAQAYRAYQLRGIEFAAKGMGFEPGGGDDTDKDPQPACPNCHNWYQADCDNHVAV